MLTCVQYHLSFFYYHSYSLFNICLIIFTALYYHYLLPASLPYRSPIPGIYFSLTHVLVTIPVTLTTTGTNFHSCHLLNLLSSIASHTYFSHFSLNFFCMFCSKHIPSSTITPSIVHLFSNTMSGLVNSNDRSVENV